MQLNNERRMQACRVMQSRADAMLRNGTITRPEWFAIRGHLVTQLADAYDAAVREVLPHV